MNIYDVYFADGGHERETIVFMATEQFRLAHAFDWAKTNTELALKQIREKYPQRQVVRLVRTMTGATVWEESNG